MSQTQSYTFGNLLKQARKHVGMTQGDLAAAVGYSISFISALELNHRLPDVESVHQRFVPALGLQDDPKLAVRLIELAAAARGERVPVAITRTRKTRIILTDEKVEEAPSLPASPTTLIGREKEVRNLGHRLLGHGGRLMTLVGPPGVGKTRLALAIAEQLQAHYQDGALFVPLATITDPTLLPLTLLSALKLPEVSSKLHKARLIEHLRRKEMLLVLDNFEQLISQPLTNEGSRAHTGGGLVAELLMECAGLRILVTSRERLHLRAEQRYQVPSLELKAAVELFAQSAGSIDANFAITDANRQLVEAICQRLDRLPLALELCAAQVELLSLSQLLAGLQTHRLDLLVAGAHDLPPQQRTLRTAIESSYALLNDDEREFFRSLGVFMGGFDLVAVAMVGYATQALGEWRLDNEVILASSLSSLRSLVSKSLVHSELQPSGDQRFLLLETLREFALEQLQAHGEQEEMRQRHYLAYLHLFRTGDGHLRGAEATSWFARLDLEQDNLRAALQWTLNTNRYADATWLLIAADYFWSLKGHRYEVSRWIARVLPHRQSFAVELRLDILINYIASASESASLSALAHYRAEIFKLFELCPSKQLQSVAMYFLAESEAEVARAYALARAAIEAPELGPEFGAHADADFVLAANQEGYAMSLLNQGEVAQAASLLRDSLARFRKRGNQAFIAGCLGLLATIAFLRGNISEAHAHIQEAVTIGHTHNLPVVHAECQSLLGLVTLYGGNVPEARRLLEECLQLCLEIRNNFPLAQVCIGLAETALWEEEPEHAAGWLEQSFAYHTSPRRTTPFELQRLFIAARLATLQGQYKRAATLFGLAEQMHSQLHYVITGPIRTLAENALSTVREELEPELFAEAFTAGQQLSPDEAFAKILAPKPMETQS